MTALFPSLLGASFQRLPQHVQILHGSTDTRIWSGTADITRGTNIIANTLANISGLPPAGTNVPITVTLTPETWKGRPSETWHRDFGGRVFRSRLFARENTLRERVGVVEFTFQLTTRDDTVIDWQLSGLTALGVPMPRFLNPRITSESFADDKTYRFNIAAELPLLGRLVTYKGWLLPTAPPEEGEAR